MEESLKYYLENTLVTNEAINSRLTHPITNLKYPPRVVGDLLIKYSIDFFKSGLEPRFISLVGLRGVGKTTLLWQTANYIQSNHSENIYFFNVNTLKNLGVSLQVALEEFQKHILKKRFIESTEPIVLLFDEVQEDDNWAMTLKILYDEARWAFILCSGSSALLLNNTADLARRMHTEKILPFSLTEFIRSKVYLEKEGLMIVLENDFSNSLKEALLFSENGEIASAKIKVITPIITKYFSAVEFSYNNQFEDWVTEYIHYRNIPKYLLYNNQTAVNNSFVELIKQIIYEDIPQLKPSFSDYSKVEKLLLRLAGSDEINPEKLAGIIGVKQQEINELIDILAKAELLNVLMPYGGLDSKITKNKKAFFMSPSIRRALLSTLYGQDLPEHFNSKLLEDIVVMYLRRILIDGIISFTSGNENVNPDFVIETRDLPIILEVGTGKLNAKQILSSKINFRYGILISNGFTEPVLKDNVIYLPLSWFLLL
jgi:predicted AAA+ superfamily ATPase